MDRLTTVNGNNNIELVINESRVKIKDTDTLAVAKKLKGIFCLSKCSDVTTTQNPQEIK